MFFYITLPLHNKINFMKANMLILKFPAILWITCLVACVLFKLIYNFLILSCK